VARETIIPMSRISKNAVRHPRASLIHSIPYCRLFFMRPLYVCPFLMRQLRIKFQDLRINKNRTGRYLGVLNSSFCPQTASDSLGKGEFTSTIHYL